jgi:hypothetical protein
MTVPYTFADATGFIPLSELDANFAATPNYANTAGNVTGNVQANITAVGVLSNLSVSGNIVGNVVGSITQAVTVTGNAQANITSVGTLTSLSVTGAVQAGFFVGNGSGLTSISVASLPASILTGNTLSANVTQSSLTTLGVLNFVSVSGNVVANNVFSNSFVGNLTGTAAYATVANSIAGSNVSGTVAQATLATNANTANTANTATLANTALSANSANIANVAYSVAGANVTGSVTNAVNVTGNAQANITSLGILSSLSSSGNITGNYILGDGSLLTNIPGGNYGNSNVASYLPTFTGNLSAGNVLTNNYCYANGQPVSFSANISGNSVIYTSPFVSYAATPRTGTSKWSDFVSALDYGADPTGVADSTLSIQAALNTGKHVYLPTGTYLVTNAITFPTPGQMLSGDGRAVSILNITNAFNLSATAVLVCDGVEEAPTLRDFGISFTQPDTTSRASLVAYPYAISAVNAPRFTIQNMLITGAINGIDLTGNSGGAYIELLEMSAFGTGISIDGSLDTIRINKFHFWPFHLSANQQTIFYSTGTRALSVGRVDGLFMDEFLNISNLGLYMFQSITYGGDSQVFITNSAFDTNNGIVQTAGHLQVTNSYITVTTTTNLNGYIMSGTGTWAQFTNCWFLSGSPNQSMILMQNCTTCSLSITQGHFVGPVTGIPYIYTGTTDLNNTSLQVSDSTFEIGTTNSYVINGVSPSSGTIMVHFVNNIVRTSPGTTYSNAMFKFSAGYRVYMTGNRGIDKGAGASTFISIATDDWNWVSGNIAPGWILTFPVSVNGYYANNPH